MVQFRDIQLKRQAREARKQDKQSFKRAVLTDEFGSQTSTDPLVDVWASESDRRVWNMTDGAVQPAQILCRKISDPYVGLGVIIGYADGSNQLEVLSDDFFLTGTGDPTGWASTAPRDFEPGGIKQMWVYSKVITPLATYPGSGIAVNIVSGDYPYAGSRKTFTGAVNFALTPNPNAGQHYLAGLYLDATNSLQVVYGASVVVATTPPEPSWPAGAFRLAAVRVNDTQTTIDFADDIFDRRMAWSDEQAGSGGWPFAAIWTVSTTDPDADYSTIQDAIDAIGVTSVGILLDSEIFTETVTFDAFAYLKGFDQGVSVISGKMTTSVGGYLEKLTISVASAEAIELTGFEGIIRECRFVATTGAGLKAVWDKIGYDLYDVTAQATGGSGNQYGYYFQPAAPATAQIFGGLYRGDTADIYADTDAIIILQGPVLYNKTIAGPGTVQGYYYDTSGNLYFVDTSGHNSGVWQIDESATLKIKRATLAAAITAAASGDSIKLDTDTYSVSASQNIGVSVTIEGDGPEATIYTTSVSNAPIFDITADSVTVVFRNLTLRHTGGGTAATGIFSNNASVTVVLDNCVLEITSGAGTDSRGLWVESGTWILRNGSKISVTSGTSKYGIYNDSAAATITISAGCEVGGDTQDIYGDQASSTLNLNGADLVNGLITWSGTISGFYTYNGTILQTNDTHLRLVLDNLASDIIGFSSGDTTANSDSYTPSSPFSKSNTGTVYFYVLNHYLRINTQSAGPAQLRWTSSTGKNDYKVYLQWLTRPVTTYGGEVRFWGVQTPGGADAYFAARFIYDATTYPDWPWRIKIFTGTGTTFAIADGTERAQAPWPVFWVNQLLLRTRASGQYDIFITDMNAPLSEVQVATYLPAGPPFTTFKTAYLWVNGTFQEVAIDSVVIT